MPDWHNSAQNVISTTRRDSKNTADERTSKEYLTQSVIARVLACEAEENGKVLHRFCREALRFLEEQQVFLPQIRAMTYSKLMG